MIPLALILLVSEYVHAAEAAVRQFLIQDNVVWILLKPGEYYTTVLSSTSVVMEKKKKEKEQNQKESPLPHVCRPKQLISI